VILNPLDARCPFWSPWFEFRPGNEPMDRAALAASLVRRQAGDTKHVYFHDNARLLLCAMFEKLEGAEREDLNSFCRFLTQSRKDIRARLDGTTAAPAMDPDAHESAGGQGIISSANTAVAGFADVTKPPALGALANGQRKNKDGSFYRAKTTRAPPSNQYRAPGWTV
jgi:hypothetical protein